MPAKTVCRDAVDDPPESSRKKAATVIDRANHNGGQSVPGRPESEHKELEIKAEPKISLCKRQSAKIREITDALTATGYTCLDAQACVLGLSRSTAWKLRQADYKHTGLSAGVINRILAQPKLPALVRTKIIEYVEAKSVGVYGHNDNQRRRFSARLSVLAYGLLLTSAAHRAARK